MPTTGESDIGREGSGAGRAGGVRRGSRRRGGVQKNVGSPSRARRAPSQSTASSAPSGIRERIGQPLQNTPDEPWLDQQENMGDAFDDSPLQESPHDDEQAPEESEQDGQEGEDQKEGSQEDESKPSEGEDEKNQEEQQEEEGSEESKEGEKGDDKGDEEQPQGPPKEDQLGELTWWWDKPMAITLWLVVMFASFGSGKVLSMLSKVAKPVSGGLYKQIKHALAFTKVHAKVAYFQMSLVFALVIAGSFMIFLMLYVIFLIPIVGAAQTLCGTGWQQTISNFLFSGICK